MLKLPFALETKYELLRYPFKIERGSTFNYKNKEYNSYLMYIDNLDLNNYKKVYDKFVKNKCFGRSIPIKHIGTMKLTVNLTEKGIKNFYLFHAKFIKYLKVLGITNVISLNKQQLKDLAYKNIEEIYKFLIDNFHICDIIDTQAEIDLGKTTLSSNSLLLAHIYLKIVDKCNQGVDFGTNFYDFIETLQLTTKEKMLINKRLEKVDNTYFYVFEEEKNEDNNSGREND